MTDAALDAAEARSARGRIAAAAAESGWSEMFGDVAENVRIYERSGRVILVGYVPGGSVTGATRMYATVNTPPRTDMPLDQLSNRDHDKAATVLAWLGESADSAT